MYFRVFFTNCMQFVYSYAMRLLHTVIFLDFMGAKPVYMRLREHCINEFHSFSRFLGKEASISIYFSVLFSWVRISHTCVSKFHAFLWFMLIKISTSSVFFYFMGAKRTYKHFYDHVITELYAFFLFLRKEVALDDAETSLCSKLKCVVSSR